VTDDGRARPARLRSDRTVLVAYFVLAALFFCQYTLLLGLIPAVAAELRASATLAGAVLVLFTGVGLLTDVPAGRVATVAGVRRTVLAGSGGLLVGSGLLAVATGVPVLVLAATVLGVASSFLLTPVLGGLSTQAGERQLRAQAVNVAVQRLGALAAALYLGESALAAGARTGAVGAAALAALLGAGALFVPSDRGPAPRPGRTPRTSAWQRTRDLYRTSWAVVRRSREASAGVVATGLIPVLAIYGSAFFPLLLVADGRTDLVAPALVAREVVAVLSAALAATALGHVPLRVLVQVSVAVSSAALLALAWVESPLWVCALFAVHGTLLGVGIMASNVHLYRGTVPETRMYGFATAGVVSRMSGIVFPVAFGVATDVSTTALMLVVALSTAGFGAAYAVLQRPGRDDVAVGPRVG
jgi:MFS family permease